jgi:hypothetical protein
VCRAGHHRCHTVEAATLCEIHSPRFA